LKGTPAIVLYILSARGQKQQQLTFATTVLIDTTATQVLRDAPATELCVCISAEGICGVHARLIIQRTLNWCNGGIDQCRNQSFVACWHPRHACKVNNMCGIANDLQCWRLLEAACWRPRHACKG